MSKIDAAQTAKNLLKLAHGGFRPQTQENSKPEFVCPLCGSQEYEDIRKGNDMVGPGFYSTRLFCKCQGCSAIFGDPAKFSSASRFKILRCHDCHQVKESTKFRSQAGPHNSVAFHGQYCHECFELRLKKLD